MHSCILPKMGLHLPQKWPFESHFLHYHNALIDNELHNILYVILIVGFWAKTGFAE
jgi:hypothetical protein